jgi:hypothetical protein
VLRPLPVEQPSQLVVPYVQHKEDIPGAAFSVPDYRDINQDTSGEFSGLIAHRALIDGLSINGRAERVMDLYVTGNFFSVMGLQPALGRLLLPSEGAVALADPVIVLSYAYWKTRFGGDSGIVGRVRNRPVLGIRQPVSNSNRFFMGVISTATVGPKLVPGSVRLQFGTPPSSITAAGSCGSLSDCARAGLESRNNESSDAETQIFMEVACLKLLTLNVSGL